MSQETTNKDKKKNSLFFGITAGTLLSKYFEGSPNEQGGLAGYTTYNVTYEKYPKLGFTAGCFADIQFKKHFSLRLDLDYYFTKHQIIYKDKTDGAIATDYYGDFYLKGSAVQFSILPKFSLGKTNRVYIIFGPYTDLWTHSSTKGQIERKVNYYPGHPASDTIITDDGINTRIKGSLGAVIGAGVNFPIKENFLCIETRFNYRFSNIIEAPNMRQYILSLNLIYQFKL